MENVNEYLGLIIEKKTIGSWEIITSQDEKEDWSYYSKDWHRQYGPKKSYSNKQIVFRHETWKKKKITLSLKKFAGDFVARAVIEANLQPKKSKFSLKIRLNKAYDAKFLCLKRGYKFYSRTLLNEHFDYVIVSPLGMTYHSSERAELITGLHNKIRNQTAKISGKLIDFAVCKKLGFCESGISEFCSVFGFSVSKSYYPIEIERAVRKNIAAAAPFMKELKILSNSLDYNVIEFV